MSLVLKELDQVALAADQAVDAVQDAQAALVDDEMVAAKEALKRASDLTHRAYQMLRGISAHVPQDSIVNASHMADPYDLNALTVLDTPDSRELLALLMQAQAVAERVDASRGRAVAADVELLPGESRGTDLAESVSELALRVRREVEGPRGKE